MSEWQDISTAPKDGTRIDLWVPDARYPVGGFRIAECFWREVPLRRDDAGKWEMGHGWVNEIEGRVDEWFEATHWQPLPHPPKENEHG